MQFKINVISEDEEFAVKQSQQLKDWIEDDEELQGLTVKQERKELQEDDAGGGLEAILDVAVNFVSDSISQTIQPIASALQTWMVEKTKRSVSEFHVELENAQGKKFRIHSKNIGDNEKALIAEIIARFEGKEDFQYKITES